MHSISASDARGDAIFSAVKDDKIGFSPSVTGSVSRKQFVLF